MFNPFKYRYNATLLQLQEGQASLRLQHGSTDQVVTLPSSLIPKEIQINERFVLTVQPEESAKQDEYASLKRLLEQLIH